MSMTADPSRADLLEADLQEVRGALARALGVPADQINPNALPDYIRELAFRKASKADDPPTWFSRTFSWQQAELEEVANWLNALRQRPGVDFVAEVSVHIVDANLLVLASVVWEELPP
jgi:hypothetical protein